MHMFLKAGNELKEEETINLVDQRIEQIKQTTSFTVLFDRDDPRFVNHKFRVFGEDVVQIGNEFQVIDCKELANYDTSLQCVKDTIMCNVYMNAMSDNYDMLMTGDTFYRYDQILYYDTNADERDTKFLWKIIYGDDKIGYINVGRDGWIGSPQPFFKNDQSGICCIPFFCVSWLSTFWTIFSYFLAIMLDILLIRQVFIVNTTFTALGISFLVGPLLAASLWAAVDCHRRYEYFQTKLPKFLFLTPIINIPLLQCQICMQSDTFYGIALSGFQAYPFFIIQISFLLETKEDYNDISIIQVLSLSKSLILLCIMPFLDVLRITAYQYQYDGFILTAKDKCKIFSRIIFLFSPIVFIEIIHFFPFLFSYYIDHSINKTQLIIILFILNVPKILFFIHMITKWEWTNKSRGCFIHLSMFVIILTISITLPLVPYIMIMLHNYSVRTQSHHDKQNKIRVINCIYYMVLIIYLWISYGSSLMYLFYCIVFANSNADDLSYPVLVSSICILLNIIFITIMISPLTMYLINARVTGIPHNLNIECKLCGDKHFQ